MIVVADTSPLNYLVQMGRESLLRDLYKEVCIPPAVLAELRHEGAPELVHRWAEHLPAWVTVVTDFTVDSTLPQILGPGEREAISLALMISASFILLDDGAGRKAAKERSLFPAGTLAVLAQASERGLIDLSSSVLDLRRLGFRVSDDLIRMYL